MADRGDLYHAAKAPAESYHPEIPKHGMTPRLASWRSHCPIRNISETRFRRLLLPHASRPIYKSYPVYHPDREPPGIWSGWGGSEPE